MPPTLSRRLNGNICLRRISSHGAQQEPQLRGINLEIKAGEIVAITGRAAAENRRCSR